MRRKKTQVTLATKPAGQNFFRVYSAHVYMSQNLMNHQKLVIIGSGPAGLTAAIYAARAELAPIILEGKHPGGQLMETTHVENFPGFPDGIMGPELIMNMRKQAVKFGADARMETAVSVDFSDPKKLIVTTEKETYSAESVILSTGASARWLGLGKGEEKYWGKGYTACATCDGAFFRNKIVGVVGGGDSACEEASFLTRFAGKVHMFVRSDQWRASKPMIKRVMENPKIEIHMQRSVVDLYGETVLEGVMLQNNEMMEVEKFALHGLFMAIGHKPNTDVFKDFVPVDNKGYFDVQGDTGSGIESVFIAGDCGDWHYRQAITAAGYGCMAALDAEKYLTGSVGGY